MLWCTGLVPLRHVESAHTRDWTCIPCTGRWIPNHWITRDVPVRAFCGLIGICVERGSASSPHKQSMCRSTRTLASLACQLGSAEKEVIFSLSPCLWLFLGQEQDAGFPFYFFRFHDGWLLANYPVCCASALSLHLLGMLRGWRSNGRDSRTASATSRKLLVLIFISFPIRKLCFPETTWKLHCKWKCK